MNLVIGAAVLCCSFSCATSFMNTGLGGAGDIFSGAGDAAADAADAVTGGATSPNLQEASTDQECGLKCGDCTEASWDYLEERYGKERSDNDKTWCQGTGLIDGQSSKTKFGKPCCIPPLTMAEQEAKGLVTKKVKEGPLQQARALCDSGDERGCAALEAAGVEGYTIRMY